MPRRNLCNARRARLAVSELHHETLCGLSDAGMSTLMRPLYKMGYVRFCPATAVTQRLGLCNMAGTEVEHVADVGGPSAGPDLDSSSGNICAGTDAVAGKTDIAEA